MKRIRHTNRARDDLLHIEAEGCVINVRVGLTDNWGHKVTSIEILPDRGKGEEWHLPDFDKGALNVRVMEGLSDKEKTEYLRQYENLFRSLMGENMSGRWMEGMWLNAHMYFGMRTPVEKGARKFFKHAQEVMQDEGTWIEEGREEGP